MKGVLGQQSAQRLKGLVSRIQRFTNLDQAEVQNANLNELLTDVAALVEPQLPSTAKLELDLKPVQTIVCRPQQISAVFNQAVSNAMTKHGITMVLPLENGMFYSNTGSYNFNPAVVAELNALLPTAKVVPPEGWQPGQAIPAAK